MKILLTNDDGIDAPGMGQMLELLAPFPCEIGVFAPKRNQSGVGHAITLGREIEIVPHPLRGREGWRVDGTPADAVKFALDNGMFTPDLVLSGINGGPNMGNNIHYSGTVGAALEAYIHNVPALALSVENMDAPRWEPAIVWGRKILEKIWGRVEKKRPGARAFLLNVNFPDIPAAAVKGVKLTRQGDNGFAEKFFPSPSGKENHYVLAGEMVFPDTAADVDTVAVRDGWVSLSPLHARLNCACHREWLRPLLAGI